MEKKFNARNVRVAWNCKGTIIKKAIQIVYKQVVSDIYTNKKLLKSFLISYITKLISNKQQYLK